MKCQKRHPHHEWVQCSMDLEIEGPRKGTHAGAHGYASSNPGHWLGNQKPLYAVRWGADNGRS